MKRRSKYSPLLLGFLIIMLACSQIPKQEFGNYVNNFNSAKSTTEDIILTVKLIAEKDYDGSHEQQVALEQRLKSLDARLAALDLISKYNEALVKLASGTDPEAVQGNLENLSEGLLSFGSTSINTLVSNVAPYGEIFAQAVAVIESAIKAKKFREAIDAAYKPIQGIIEILIQDANDLFEIQNQMLGDQLDPKRDRIIDLRFEFQDFVNTLTPDGTVENAISDFNEVLNTMQVNPDKLPDPIVHLPKSSRSPTGNDYSVLTLLIYNTTEQIAGFNSLKEQMKAIEIVKIEYKKVLVATSQAFTQINFAIQNKQRTLPIDFAVDVLNLRKAYIQLQESKQK